MSEVIQRDPFMDNGKWYAKASRVQEIETRTTGPHSTNFEAKRAGDLLARNMSSVETAVMKGDMPTLTPPINTLSEDKPITRARKAADEAEASPTHEQLREIGRQVAGLLKACGLDKKETAAESIAYAAKLVTSLRKQVHALIVDNDRKEEALKALDKVKKSVSAYGAAFSKVCSFHGVTVSPHPNLDADALDAICLHVQGVTGSKIRQLTEEVASLDGQIEVFTASVEHARHFTRSMGIKPTVDLKADLSACLAKYAKTSSDLDAAIKNYRNALADWSAAKAEAATSEEAMGHMVKALAALTGATLDDDG